MKKRQVLVSSEILEAIQQHPLYAPGRGRGEGEGAVGWIDLALSWALLPTNTEGLKAYKASFELERLKAEQAAITARIQELSGAPAPTEKKPAKAAKVAK